MRPGDDARKHAGPPDARSRFNEAGAHAPRRLIKPLYEPLEYAMLQ